MVRGRKLALLFRFAKRCPHLTTPTMHWWEEDDHMREQIHKANHKPDSDEPGKLEDSTGAEQSTRSLGTSMKRSTALSGSEDGPKGEIASGCGPAPPPRRAGLAHLVSETVEAKAVREIGFLFQSYQVSCWFWELVTLGKKLIFTSVLSLLWRGSILQVRRALRAVDAPLLAEWRSDRLRTCGVRRLPRAPFACDAPTPKSYSGPAHFATPLPQGPRRPPHLVRSRRDVRDFSTVRLQPTGEHLRGAYLADHAVLGLDRCTPPQGWLPLANRCRTRIRMSRGMSFSWP